MFKAIPIVALVLLTSFMGACTGKDISSLTSLSVEKGGIVIVPGEKMTVDLQDVINMNVTDYTVTLKTITADFVSSPIYDLTDFAKEQIASSDSSSFLFVMPKSVQAAKPILIVVDIPDLNLRLTDVIFDGQTYVRPGIASKFAFDLVRSYSYKNNAGKDVFLRALSSFRASEFDGIKKLIQARIDTLIKESENLSLATISWKKLSRYLLNGLAFNIDFLNAVKTYGVSYDFTAITPASILVGDTPENSLANYRYAGNFKVTVNGVSINAGKLPFDHELNLPAGLLSGATQPNPATNIRVPEGKTVSVTAQGSDPEDDFIDKNMIIKYSKRILPTAVTSRAIYDVSREQQDSRQEISRMSAATAVDKYESSEIGYHEALDLSFWGTGTTARREIYYLVSDGMIRLPYRWEFVYNDVNRAPRFVLNATGGINSTLVDQQLINNGEVPSASGWLIHGSHCETDPSNREQVIVRRSDGPWSCAFKVTDPDLDDDPNAAPDDFYYTVNVGDDGASAELSSGDPAPGAPNPVRQIWPPILPATRDNPLRVQGRNLLGADCPLKSDGTQRTTCGLGVTRVEIDNAVKLAADGQADQKFTYSILVYDRPAAIGGFLATKTITRKVEFVPVPGRLINYGNTNGDPGLAAINDYVNPNCSGNCEYRRWDIFLNEITQIIDPSITRATLGFDDTIAGSANRSWAQLQQPNEIPAGIANQQMPVLSPYITRPHSRITNYPAPNVLTPDAASGTQAFNWLSHALGQVNRDLPGNYQFPREQNIACRSLRDDDLWGLGWDQTSAVDSVYNSAGALTNTSNPGWVFEMNALDLDNVDLKLGEPSDPINFNISHDVDVRLNRLGLQYCNYIKPEKNLSLYETYNAITAASGMVTSNVSAKDADACVWSAVKPDTMQPVPLYFWKRDTSGNWVKRKFVYHRLRFKWQPKDQGPLRSATDPKFQYAYDQNSAFIRNIIYDLVLSGRKTTDRRDISTVSQPINLYALHHEKNPCAFRSASQNTQGGVTAGATSTEYLHREYQNPTSYEFVVADENRRLGSSNSFQVNDALRGRYEVELTAHDPTQPANGLMGRSIFDARFLRMIPFIKNCTRVDTVALPGATPSPQKVLNGPPVFYSSVNDTIAGTPRLRLVSTSVDNNAATSSGYTNLGQFCISHQFEAQKKDNQYYNEVISITNNENNWNAMFLGRAAQSYSLGVNEVLVANGYPANCTDYSDANPLMVYPDQSVVVVPSVCGNTGRARQLNNAQPIQGSLVNGMVPQYTISSGAQIIPTDYNLPANTNITFDLFSDLYGSTRRGQWNPQAFVIARDPITNDPTAWLPWLTPAGADFNWTNVLYWNVHPVNTFVLNNQMVPTYKNTAAGVNPYGEWTPSLNATTSMTGAPFDYYGTYGVQYLDWDHQIAAASVVNAPTTCTGSNTCYLSPDGLATDVKVFVRNRAQASLAIRASDVVLNGTNSELDPYDIKQFVLINPTVASNIPTNNPTFTRNGLNNCSDSPINYANLSTLTDAPLTAMLNNMANYQSCTFNWTPTAADDGKEYTWEFAVQDNAGATLNSADTVFNGFGQGGRYPAGVFGGIPSNESPLSNGPMKKFTVTFKSVETNIQPYFLSSSGGATLANAYNSTTGGTGWTSVIPANTAQGTAAGIMPACASASAPFLCPTAAETVRDGEQLQSTVVINMNEKSQTDFKVFVKDDNVTRELKTISAIPPGYVLILDGPNKGRKYLPPTLQRLSTVGAAQVGSGSFSFSWTPLDSEANYLSNPGGFLIPINITDTEYKPSEDSKMADFKVPAKSNRVWLWAKINVVNSEPQIFYIDGNNAKPLNTITLQTGDVKDLRFSIRDTDVARLYQSTGESNSFQPQFSFSSAGPTFSGALTNMNNFPQVSPVPNATNPMTVSTLYHDFTVRFTPQPTDIGTYQAQITVTDPGDPSLGLAVNPDNSNPPRARIETSSNQKVYPFTIQVVGRPQFLVPNASATLGGSQVTAYTRLPFFHPLSLMVSRQDELANESATNFFIGIDQSTTVTPVRKLEADAGIYVNTKHVLRWPAPLTENVVGSTRAIPLFAVLKSRCATSGTIVKKLIRFIDGPLPAGVTSRLEVCNLTQATLNADTANQNLSILLAKDINLATIPGGTTMTVERSQSFTNDSATNIAKIDQQYADFKSRCEKCGSSSTMSGDSGGSPSGLIFNASSSTGSGGVTFTSNDSVASTFTFDASSGPLIIKKTFVDSAVPTATPGRTLNVTASESESLTFKATVGAFTGTPQYRWYVNGCLKASGQLIAPANGDPAQITYTHQLTSLSGGVNNNCSGEFKLPNEPGSAALGRLVVRLNIVNDTETVDDTTDGATRSFVYKVTIINRDPFLLNTDTLITTQKPVIFNTNYLSGNGSIEFAMPVTVPSTSTGKNFLAFTDASSSAGLKIRLREIDESGNIPVTGRSSIVLSCGITSNLTWMGIHPEANKLTISASTDPSFDAGNFRPSYLTGTNAQNTYITKSQTCFTDQFTYSASTLAVYSFTKDSFTFGSKAYDPGVYLGLSKNTISKNATTAISMDGAVMPGVRDTSATALSYPQSYLVDGTRATRNYWSTAMGEIYASSPPQEFVNFQNNVVRKNIQYRSASMLGTTNYLIQMIGAAAVGQNSWKGSILVSSLAPSSNTLSGTVVKRITFDKDSTLASECKFDGTPVDGIYHAATDSLYAVSYANMTDSKGRFIQISGLLNLNGTPTTCREVSQVMNPSLARAVNNTNIAKMAIDEAKGMVYGVVNGSVGSMPQLFAYDVYTQEFNLKSLPLMTAYELIYSPRVDALYLMDNRKDTGTNKNCNGVACVPTLYRIW